MFPSRVMARRRGRSSCRRCERAHTCHIREGAHLPRPRAPALRPRDAHVTLSCAHVTPAVRPRDAHVRPRAPAVRPRDAHVRRP
eukprot:4594130-Prymnesium_polylepis.1